MRRTLAPRNTVGSPLRQRGGRVRAAGASEPGAAGLLSAWLARRACSVAGWRRPVDRDSVRAVIEPETGRDKVVVQVAVLRPQQHPADMHAAGVLAGCLQMRRGEVVAAVLDGHQAGVERLAADSAVGRRRYARQVGDCEAVPVGGRQYLSLRRERGPEEAHAAADAE